MKTKVGGLLISNILRQLNNRIDLTGFYNLMYFAALTGLLLREGRVTKFRDGVVSWTKGYFFLNKCLNMEYNRLPILTDVINPLQNRCDQEQEPD